MITKVTNQHNYTLGDLKTVDQFDRTKTYLKIINKEKLHSGIYYKKGINNSIIPFNSSPYESFVDGGLYFTTLEFLPSFGDHGKYVAEIKILEDSQLVLIKNNDKYLNKTQYKTNKFEIIKFWEINDFFKHVGYIDMLTHLNLYGLSSTKGLETLESVGGNINMNSTATLKGLVSLKYIGGNAFFNDK